MVGVTVLMNFLLRIIFVLWKGTAFPEFEPRAVAVASVLVHAVLSCTSLLLPLPQKRNFQKPMIWPEFRLHSILFACRHVLCTVIALLGLWPEDFLASVCCKTLVVVCTVTLAGFITERYGEKVKRTTNAMPYPEGLTEAEQQGIKKNYARAQFLATLHAVLGDPTCAFVPLYGIQGAPLLMTLVRKGLISSAAYHRVYSSALYLPYIFMIYRIGIGALELAPIFTTGILVGVAVIPMRVKWHLDVRLVWLICTPLCLVAARVAQDAMSILSHNSTRALDLAFAIGYGGYAPFGARIAAYKVLFTKSL